MRDGRTGAPPQPRGGRKTYGVKPRSTRNPRAAPAAGAEEPPLPPIRPVEDPPPEPMTSEEFAAACNVSRETMVRLETYVALLRDWQTRKNLVAPSTLADPWRRHFLDSAQLLSQIDAGAEVVDIGTGAGFPGMALAILGVQNMRLVESDQGKCAFLRAVGEATGTAVEIYPDRTETLARDSLAQIADVVVARAVAPLPKLLRWAAPLLTPGGYCLFLKGARASEELTAAGKDWRMTATRIPSRSDPSGTVLRLENLRRAAQRR